MTAKSIAQWASSLVNEDNVKICVLLIPDADNTDANPSSGWVVYSGSL